MLILYMPLSCPYCRALTIPMQLPLRTCLLSTHDQRMCLSQGIAWRFSGILQAGDKKKWRAMIQHNHEQHHVGYYPTAEEAARAYDRKALLFMGPSAITNFPATDYNGINLEADGSVEDQVDTPAAT